MGVFTTFIGMVDGGETCAVDWARPVHVQWDAFTMILADRRPDTLAECVKRLVASYVDGYDPVLWSGKFFGYAGGTTQRALDGLCKLLSPAQGQSASPGALYLVESTTLVLLTFDTGAGVCSLFKGSLDSCAPLLEHYGREVGGGSEDGEDGEDGEDEAGMQLISIVKSAYHTGGVHMSPDRFVDAHDEVRKVVESTRDWK